MVLFFILLPISDPREIPLAVLLAILRSYVSAWSQWLHLELELDVR